MTPTTAIDEAKFRAFMDSAETQQRIRIMFANINEIRVADHFGITRREARAALKLAGKWM